VKEVDNSASESHARGSPLLIIKRDHERTESGNGLRIPGSGSEFRGVEAKAVWDGEVRGLKLAGDFWAWRIGRTAAWH
jgi:hypothetical protein